MINHVILQRKTWLGSPLDNFGTTAEMGKTDAGEDIVIFKNKIRNFAFSVVSDEEKNKIDAQG